jgi:hypothetical protein
LLRPSAEGRSRPETEISATKNERPRLSRIYRAALTVSGSEGIVAQLQKRIEELARESAKSLFLVEAMGAVKGAAHGPPALPNEDAYFTHGD